MGLIYCGNCEGKVSDMLEACPHCGHPMVAAKPKKKAKRKKIEVIDEDEPATVKQIEYAKRLGIENPEVYKKWELSDLIQDAVDERDYQKELKRERDHEIAEFEADIAGIKYPSNFMAGLLALLIPGLGFLYKGRFFLAVGWLLFNSWGYATNSVLGVSLHLIGAYMSFRCMSAKEKSIRKLAP